MSSAVAFVHLQLGVAEETVLAVTGVVGSAEMDFAVFVTGAAPKAAFVAEVVALVAGLALDVVTCTQMLEQQQMQVCHLQRLD